MCILFFAKIYVFANKCWVFTLCWNFATHFIDVISLNLHMCSHKEHEAYRWENWGPTNLSNMPQVTQLASGVAGIHSQLCLVLEPTLLNLKLHIFCEPSPCTVPHWQCGRAPDTAKVFRNHWWTPVSHAQPQHPDLGFPFRPVPIIARQSCKVWN